MAAWIVGHTCAVMLFAQFFMTPRPAQNLANQGGHAVPLDQSIAKNAADCTINNVDDIILSMLEYRGFCFS